MTPNFEDLGPAVSYSSQNSEFPGSTKQSKRRQRTQLLAAEIEELVEELRPHDEVIKQRDEFIHELRKYILLELPGCSLAPFGSAVNGLWMADRDLDLCVEAPRVHGREAVQRLLRHVGSAIYRLSGERPEPRLTARMPLLRWEPSSESGFACDITVNNTLAVLNSRLISQYVSMDPRMQSLALVLKAWARARRINDRSRGTVSSFAITLMLISFLQRRFVLPSLQDLAAKKGDAPVELTGPYGNLLDCRFCEDPDAISDELKRLQSTEPKRQAQNLGSLAQSFFRYFGDEYRYGVIAIRDTSGLPMPSPLQNPFLFVDNPFEPGRDVANISAANLLRVRNEFRHAHLHLSRGKPLKDLTKLYSASTSEGSAL